MQADKKYYFGRFGGRFAPEILFPALEELSVKFKKIVQSSDFSKRYQDLLKQYIGRPTPLYFAERFSALTKNKNRVFFKREDLCHTGSHKLNNALGQALLAVKLGKTRIIAETGAGQHGVATATAAALLNLKCTVYMGKLDTERQAPNVQRMRLLGAEVIPVEYGNMTLKDAVNEAFKDWTATHKNTHYVIGSVVGPDPFPNIVKHFQRVIGQEASEQYKKMSGRKSPDIIVACVGAGSNAIGLFTQFIENNSNSEIYGVEAAGLGVDTSEHSAKLTKGEPGILHGAYTYILQDDNGQIIEPYSISAGLDYPGVGPEHSYLKDIGKVKYVSATDNEAVEAFKVLTRIEGIIPALESSHAVAFAFKLLRKRKNCDIIVCLSGRGDKDLNTILSKE